MIRYFLLLMIVNSSGYADITTDVECTQGGTVTGTEACDDLIWQQLPAVAWHLLSSQYFIDYDQSSEVADDFRWESGAEITEVKWWGGYWQCTGEPFDPDFTIFIYGDNGEIPTPPYSGTQLAEFAITSGATGETYDPGLDLYFYASDAVGFYAQPDTKYWIVFQADLEFATQGMWGVASTDEGYFWENPVYFTGNMFGITSWVDCMTQFGFEVDIAFEFQGILSLEQTTWGGLKKLF